MVVIPTSVIALPEVIDDIPESARVWENRSNHAGSDYQEIQGADIAYINQDKGGWYFRDPNGQWQLFFEGDTLDLSESYDADLEALGYEVVSGTAFFDNGSASMYQMQLHGPTGELLTEDGVKFNPHDYELLKGQKNKRAYFNVVTGQWWPASPELVAPLSRPITGPYTPLYLKPDLVPATPNVNAANLSFDPETLRYLNSNGSVAAFHPHNASDFRRWTNEANMPCADYSNYPGQDVVYVAGTWYHVVGDSEFRPFFDGRYFDFSDQHDHEYLEVSLTHNTQVGSEGTLEGQSIYLDGETGQLVNENYQPLDPNSYHSPDAEQEDCDISYSITLNDSLFFEGVEGLTSPTLSIAGGLASEQPFMPTKRQVTLLQVVPLQNIDNDPFNERTLPLTINKARAVTAIAPTQVIVTPKPVKPKKTTTQKNDDKTAKPKPAAKTDPAPDPVSDPDPAPVGSCPLNTALTSIAALPESAPLTNYIGISTGNQLNAGLTVGASEQALVINNSFSTTEGSVSMGAGFSYVSGSALGTITEGTNLTYIIRRNSDSTEFEVSFTFSAEIVFDDPGIVINSLAGKLCVAGGPG